MQCGLEFGDLDKVAGKLGRLLAIGRRLDQPVRGEVVPAAPGQGPGEPAEEPLALAVRLNVVRLGQLVGFVEPAVPQRGFRSFHSKDTHRSDSRRPRRSGSSEPLPHGRGSAVCHCS
jgi:hypothetical protein